MPKSRHTPARPSDLRKLHLTKIDVAEAHLKVAITLYFEDAHPVPIYHLAAAAREILTTLAVKENVETVLHDVSKEKNIPLTELVRDLHRYAKFFKHADRDPDETLEFNEDNVDILLAVACRDFGRLLGGMPIEAQVFEAFVHTLSFDRISDAPLRSQRTLRNLAKAFPGLRSASRREQKRIGKAALIRALADPSLVMAYPRKPKGASNGS